MSTLKQSVATQQPDAPKPLETKKQQPKDLPDVTPAWVRPFVTGGACGVGLVLFILILIPSTPIQSAAAPAPSEVGKVVAQAEPVIESVLDERPLPKLSPNLPATWYKPETTSPAASPSTSPRKFPSAPPPSKVEAQFTPTPAYQPPARQRDWADEALADPTPATDSK